MIIAACGHKTILEHICWLAERNNDGSPRLRHTCLCSKCYREAKRDGRILVSEADRTAWMNRKDGKIDLTK